MFKHTVPEEAPASKKIVAEEKKVERSVIDANPSVPLAKDVSPAALRDLLEKNLKWSQIIYEQNRKINNKLFWTAFANWLRLLLLVGSFAAAIYFLPPLINKVFSAYKELLPIGQLGSLGQIGQQAGSSSTLQDILKLLPVGTVDQEKLKTILNK